MLKALNVQSALSHTRWFRLRLSGQSYLGLCPSYSVAIRIPALFVYLPYSLLRCRSMIRVSGNVDRCGAIYPEANNRYRFPTRPGFTLLSPFRTSFSCLQNCNRNRSIFNSASGRTMLQDNDRWRWVGNPFCEKCQVALVGNRYRSS